MSNSGTQIAETSQAGQNGVSEPSQEARTGAVILALHAKRTSPAPDGWVKRRVEQLEFIDTRAVRWHVSVDFVIPAESPKWKVGSDEFFLIPIDVFPKDDLVAFDLRDENNSAIWLPTSDEGLDLFGQALVWIAKRTLNKPLSTDIEDVINAAVAGTEQSSGEDYDLFGVAGELIDAEDRLKQLNIMSDRVDSGNDSEGIIRRRRLGSGRTGAQNRLNSAKEKFGKLPDGLRDDAYYLMSDESFRSQLAELSSGFLMFVGFKGVVGDRRIVKLTWERQLNYQSEDVETRRKDRIAAYLTRRAREIGWKHWPAYIKLGGTGGSHHLEVATPPGLIIDFLIAQRLDPGQAGANDIVAHGGSPHVHMHVPAKDRHRYEAAIYMRVQRTGWLGGAFGVALILAVSLWAAFLSQAIPFLHDPNPSPEQGGTAATLLLAFLGLSATCLIRSGEHPLASKLLRLVRVLLLIDVGVALIGAGSLILRNPSKPEFSALWLGLSITATAVCALAALSLILPWGLPQPHKVG